MHAMEYSVTFLVKDLRGVLGADQAGFEHGEAGRHPHDQCATDQEVKRIHGVLQFKNLVFHYLTPAKNVLHCRFVYAGFRWPARRFHRYGYESLLRVN